MPDQPQITSIVGVELADGSAFKFPLTPDMTAKVHVSHIVVI
jgi:hypothetical protein